MNARERFNRIMHFRAPDRVPLWSAEGVAEGTIRQWIVDGDLPIGVRREDVASVDPVTLIRLDTDPLPAFVPEVLAEDDQWRTVTDEYGFTLRTSKTQAVGPVHYYYLDGPIHDPGDWERMKGRFDPTDPHRLPRDWSAELFERHNGSPGPVGMRIDWGPGRGIKNGYMMGTDRFLAAVIDEPGRLAGMFEFWADFVIETARGWFKNVRFDFVILNEDGMAFKNSTFVSPDTYRRIWARPVGKVVDFVRRQGVDVVGYLTSGNITPLIPALLDIGVNLHQPLECAAGIDARDLRRRFGQDLLLIGNISRQSLMDGPEAVEKEFREKVPPLMEAGGYIPAIDDVVMPDMPYASFRRYRELAGGLDV